MNAGAAAPTICAPSFETTCLPTCGARRLVIRKSVPTDSARTAIVSDDDKRYDVAFSLKGFSGAHDAMANLARQKAGAAAPAAAPAPAAEEDNNPPPRRRRR